MTGNPSRLGRWVMLLFVSLVAGVPGEPQNTADGRGVIGGAQCQGESAGVVSVPGVLVPFYLGMTSMGVCMIAHVYQICRRALAAGSA
ncbi:envelope glycoprotein N [Chimpanzee herpesvirus strain 105640]|uniref:Envelope glycoprotein N n=1 Tax=Chimpanzee herpesvirus strain 105640 TaxID=332937 RepID=K9MFZ2_9ALPH|nr:envelope glycoprotein N [Chimpanzee herpesvirus strain 105640]AFV26939.1 envelope glycoprotein N [Chimpanzee herpesvirus strain 105640]